jgi:uroporphyrin-III C-methyltransferase
MSVAIVGAGPGDPGLVTVRALELVRRSEILVYDRLVSMELVLEAVGAARISRDGLTQQEVNELLVHHGRRGRRVVRLKGGDPFIFGRGAEEVEALTAAGVPYEVVPGLSTLTAVPALAGIPLTHREISGQVTVITGTRADGGELDYDHLASTPGTLVIFMGLRRLATIADRLILAGRRVDEGAAVISRLSLGDASVRVGTLGTIAAVARGMATPSVVIIGDVALQAERLRELAETCDRGGDALATRREAVLDARRPVVDQQPRKHSRPFELG